MDTTLRVGSFIKYGWETFQKRGWFLILATVIYILAAVILKLVVIGIFAIVLPSTIATGLGDIIGLGISIFVAMGWTAFSLKTAEDISSATLSELWHPQLFWSYFAMSLLYGFAVVIGFILFIVPGIIAMSAFVFAPYFVIDKGLGPIEALKASARVTKGNRLRILGLIGATFLVALLGVILLGVGILVAIPVVAIATARAYRSFSVAADTNQPHQSLSGGEITLLLGAFLVWVAIIALYFFLILFVWLPLAESKPGVLQGAVQRSSLQIDLEVYKTDNKSYPASLSDLSSDPNTPDSLQNISLNNFSYTQLKGGTDYQLCSQEIASYVPGTGGETNTINPCVNSPEDATDTAPDTNYQDTQSQ